MEFHALLLGLALVWLASKVAGEAMERVGQTAVLGELLAGVAIGPSVLGLVHESEVLHALAELGVLILLFEVGLKSDLGELLRAGFQATLVATVGVVLPFAIGFAVMRCFGHPPLLAVFVGATLTATSVGITARILADLGRLDDSAGKVVLGAAVVDDILGLIILAVVTGVAETGAVSLPGVALLAAKAVAFLVAAIMVGIRLAPTIIGWINLMKARGTLIVYSVVFAVTLAALADLIGLATIIGAFAAGLVLATTERREHIEDRIKPVADLLVPVFFVTIGMKVHPAMLNPFAQNAQLGLAMLLTAVAVASKLAAGLVVYQKGVRRWPVGVGMVPRGEVGLIFAGAGLAAAVVAEDLYSALVVVVMLTTFIAPPWLKVLYRRGSGLKP
ncbi:MAG TPA: cation:proton antiporter [Candidatus Dormibacteraeota bacterium]|jgi:Kef-type K+ transport system membrane component KefB|nr:cation:proton antiporter [Candidatus Dormibacteraeota bacterium]